MAMVKSFPRFVAFVLLLSAALLSSCQRGGVVYDGTKELPEGRWMRFEPTEFDIDVRSAEDCYEIEAVLVLDTSRFREAALPIVLKVVSPAGETRTLFSTIMLKGTDGRCLAQGSQAGGCLFRQRVREYFYFNNKGAHRISVGQRTSRYEISGIHSIGITISKAQLELPK